MGPTRLLAETISGTVQDPSGAVIAGARIEITGGDLTQPLVLASDGLGKFASPDLKPGTYSLRVTREGFEPLIKDCRLAGRRPTATHAQHCQTTGDHLSSRAKSLAFANSDPCLPATPRPWTGRIVSNRQFHVDVRRCNLSVSERNADVPEPGGWSCNRRDLHRGRTLQSEAGDSPRRRELSRRTGAAEVNEELHRGGFPIHRGRPA